MALAGLPVLIGYLASQADNQSPGQLRGALSCPTGAADHDAQLGSCLDVEYGISSAGGDQQPELGKPGQQAAGEGRSFPHPHDHLKVLQALHQ